MVNPLVRGVIRGNSFVRNNLTKNWLIREVLSKSAKFSLKSLTEGHINVNSLKSIRISKNVFLKRIWYILQYQKLKLAATQFHWVGYRKSRHDRTSFGTIMFVNERIPVKRFNSHNDHS